MVHSRSRFESGWLHRFLSTRQSFQEVIEMKGPELMDRIRDEMAAKNDYIASMGELMTEYLRLHPECEIDDKKNLSGAYNALRESARKKAKGGCYAMPPQEVFRGMIEYFGLPHADADYRACMAAMIGQSVPDAPTPIAPAAPTPEPKRSAGGLDDLLDLDALMGV